MNKKAIVWCHGCGDDRKLLVPEHTRELSKLYELPPCPVEGCGCVTGSLIEFVKPEAKPNGNS